MARPKTKTTAQIKNDYAKKAYDDIRLQVKKGQKEIIKAHAETQGESVNGFINRAIVETIERDSGVAPEIAGKHPEMAQGAGVVSLPSGTIETAQRAAEAAGECLPDFVRRAVEIQAKRDALSR